MNHNNETLPEDDEQFLADVVETLAVRPWNNVIHSHYTASSAAQVIQARAAHRQALAAERYAVAAEQQIVHLGRLARTAERMEDEVEEAGRAALLIVRCLNSAQDAVIDQKDVSIPSTNTNLDQAKKSKSYKASLEYLRDGYEELAEMFQEAFAPFSDTHTDEEHAEEHDVQARKRLAQIVVLAKRIVFEVEDESPALERLEAAGTSRRTANT